MTTPTQQTVWRLLAATNDAGAELAQAEALLAKATMKVHKIDSIISRLRALAVRCGLNLTEPTPAATEVNLNVREFAKLMGWGERRMRALVRNHMVEGEHFSMNGRRYVIHADKAGPFVRRFSSGVAREAAVTEEKQIVDELTRRRAVTARRRVGS